MKGPSAKSWKWSRYLPVEVGEERAVSGEQQRDLNQRRHEAWSRLMARKQHVLCEDGL